MKRYGGGIVGPVSKISVRRTMHGDKAIPLQGRGGLFPIYFDSPLAHSLRENGINKRALGRTEPEAASCYGLVSNDESPADDESV